MNWKYEDGRIFSTDEKGELMAEVTYVNQGAGTIDIDHVYVNPALRGQGVAGKAMIVVTEYLKKNGLKATASCSYANTWFTKNREQYSDIISTGIENQAAACKIDGKH